MDAGVNQHRGATRRCRHIPRKPGYMCGGRGDTTFGSNVKVNRMCGWASKTIHGSTDQGTLISVSADFWRPEPIQFAPGLTAENPLDLQPDTDRPKPCAPFGDAAGTSDDAMLREGAPNNVLPQRDAAFKVRSHRHLSQVGLNGCLLP